MNIFYSLYKMRLPQNEIRGFRFFDLDSLEFHNYLIRLQIVSIYDTTKPASIQTSKRESRKPHPNFSIKTNVVDHCLGRVVFLLPPLYEPNGLARVDGTLPRKLKQTQSHVSHRSSDQEKYTMDWSSHASAGLCQLHFHSYPAVASDHRVSAQPLHVVHRVLT